MRCRPISTYLRIEHGRNRNPGPHALMDTKDTECILEPLSLDNKENGTECSAVDHFESKRGKTNVMETKVPWHRLWGWSLQGMTLVVLSVIIVSASITIALVISLLAGLRQIQPHGSVVSESVYCSRLGLDVLQKRDGNAVDAAVVTSFCMSITRPDLASLAGCGLILVHEHNSQPSHLYDSMCTAPAGAKIPNESKPLTSVGVPGFVQGLALVHHRFGKIPWPDLFHDLIQLAYSGFKPEPDLAQAAAQATSINLPGTENIVDLLKNIDGPTYLPPSDLPKTLRNISQQGADYLYFNRGDDVNFVQRVLVLMNSSGASWESSDLSGYAVKQPKAIQMGFAGFTVQAFPAPSGGPFLLNLLSNLDLMDVIFPLDRHALARSGVTVTATVLHRLLELAKFAQIATQDLGDPYDSLIASSVLKAQDRLLSFSERRTFVNTLSDTHATPVTPPSPPQFDSNIGSTGILTTDSSGLTVVISSFLGSPFGSGIIVPGTGIHLNSALRLFSTQGGTSLNSIAPGRRPLVPISPVYVLTTHRKCGVRFGVASRDGFSGTFDAAQVIANAALFLRRSTCRVQFAIDSHSSGAHPVHRFNGTFPTLSDYTPAADSGCINARVAIDLPRLFLNATAATNTTKPTFSVSYEPGYEQELVHDLAKRGHQMEEYTGAWRGRVAIVGWDRHRLVTSSDKRGSSLNLLSY